VLENKGNAMHDKTIEELFNQLQDEYRELKKVNESLRTDISNLESALLRQCLIGNTIIPNK